MKSYRFGVAIGVAALALTGSAVRAAPILTEDFNATPVNPTADPFTTDLTWDYSDSINSAIGTNESRLFNPAAAGSGTNSVGWISLIGSNEYTRITTSGTFAGLPALAAGQAYQFTLSFFAAGETTEIVRDINGEVIFASVGANFSNVAGSNGAITIPARFNAQTLSDQDPAADIVELNFVAEGGAGGVTSDRTFTTTWTSTDALDGATYALSVGFTQGTTNPPFGLYDNIALDVTVVPEPAGLAVLGLGACGLLVRRRKASR